MTPELVAQDIADSYEDAMSATTQLPDILVSTVHTEGADTAVFYVDVHTPGEGNQRFTVTVTESTDIQS